MPQMERWSQGLWGAGGGTVFARDYKTRRRTGTIIRLPISKSVSREVPRTWHSASPLLPFSLDGHPDRGGKFSVSAVHSHVFAGTGPGLLLTGAL